MSEKFGQSIFTYYRTLSPSLILPQWFSQEEEIYGAPTEQRKVTQ